MSEFATFLTALSPEQLSIGIAITAAIVSIVIDWRLALFSVLVQYLFLTLLLNTDLPGGLAMVKLEAGAVACLVLYWSARRIEHALDEVPGSREWFVSNREIYPMGLPFRFLALIFVTLVLLPLPDRFSFVPIERPFLVPALWLLAMGLLTIILTRDPLKTGMGLLTFQNGFELLYALVEPGLAVMGLLGIGTMMVALVASYLAVAQHLPLIEARQAEMHPDPKSPEALAEAVAALKQTPAPPPEAELLVEQTPQDEEGVPV